MTTTPLTPIPAYDGTGDAGTFGPDAEELAMFGPEEFGAPESAPEQPEPARGKPGPKPNPNSKRQQKLAAATRRARTAPAPAKRSRPNTPAKPAATPEEAHLAGAHEIIGTWVAQPLAMAGFALGLAATQAPNMPEARRRTLGNLSMALTLDSFTVALHADELAAGLAAAAPSLPWLARGLETAAKIGPYAGLAKAGSAILLQVLCNHGVMPAMAALGTLSADELAAAAGVPMDGPPAE